MAEKILNTRILLKYDILGKVSDIESEKGWVGHNPKLLKGEVAVVAVESAPTKDVNSVAAPQILFKVGDGTHKFNELPWATGLAADVYGWAKKSAPDIEDFKSILPADTNTTYQLIAGSKTGLFKLQKQEKGASGWTDVTNDAGIVEFGTNEDAIKKLITAAQTKADDAYALADDKVDKTVAIGTVEAVSGKANQITVKTVSGASKSTITINNVAEAGHATKATQDNSGNVITTTYATKTELTTGLSGKLGSTAQAADSAKLEGKTKAQIIEEARANLATTSYVDNKVAEKVSGAVQHLGTATSSAEITQFAAKADSKGDFIRIGKDIPAESSKINTALHANDILIAEVYPACKTTVTLDNWKVVHGEDVGVVEIKQGSGITISDGKTATPTISHADTSSQASSKNSGRTYIQSVELDGYGHVTKLATGTETVVDTNTWRDINVNGTQLKGNGINTGAVNFKNGSNVTITGSGNDITISASDSYKHPAGSAANKAEGFYKISTDETSHVKSATAVTAEDITNTLGYIPGKVNKVNAGQGLTGGGVGDNGVVTVNVGKGTGITVNENDIAVTDYNNILTHKGGNGLQDEAGNTIIFCCGNSNC